MHTTQHQLLRYRRWRRWRWWRWWRRRRRCWLLDQRIANVVSGYSAQNQTHASACTNTVGIILVVAIVRGDRESDSRSGARADESTHNRARPPAALRKIRAPRDRQKDDTDHCTQT